GGGWRAWARTRRSKSGAPSSTSGGPRRGRRSERPRGPRFALNHASRGPYNRRQTHAREVPMSAATAQPVTYGHDTSAPTWSVTRYQRMTELGILTTEDKVELLENYIVLKLPRTPLHDGTAQFIHPM